MYRRPVHKILVQLFNEKDITREMMYARAVRKILVPLFNEKDITRGMNIEVTFN